MSAVIASIFFKAGPEDQEALLPGRNVPGWVLHRNGHVRLYQESPGILWKLWSRHCNDLFLPDLHHLLPEGDRYYFISMTPTSH